MAELVCAVDVGTGSARAGVFDRAGRMLGRAEHPVLMHRPRADHAEQDSEDIWRAVCLAVKVARDAAGAAAGDIAGLAFDATCSLVMRDGQGSQVSASTSGERRWDTIVWLDHRALAEADECSATRHSILATADGVMSPEMAVPKLMWLKRHLPQSWASAGMIADLADFLSFRATGSTARSQSTLGCKWTYQGERDPPWDAGFFAAVGLDDIFARAGLPERAVDVGAEIGRLTPAAAAELGLTTNCRVAAGLIDAYSGALGVLGGLAAEPDRLEGQMALVAGTSSCVIAFSPERRGFPGGWGPYLGAALPGLWTGECGQSATGALLDHVIRLHSAGGEPTPARHADIARRIAELRQEQGRDFARRLHVLPDFHGNRSPLADPHALGVISGLSLDASFDGLCRLYWRAAVSIALGLRQIVEHMRDNGFAVETLHAAGGHLRNPLLMELYADALDCALTEPAQDGDAMLLGAAMAAAAGAGFHPNLAAACRAMQRPSRPRHGNPAARSSLDRDYRIFLEMQRQRTALDAL